MVQRLGGDLISTALWKGVRLKDLLSRAQLSFKEIVNAYVRRGIDRNQINVLLIYKKEQQKFIESIGRSKNVNLLSNSQNIMIIPADEGFYDDGSFSAIPSLNSIRELEELAKQKSKNGLNVLATLPTKLTEQSYDSSVLN